MLILFEEEEEKEKKAIECTEQTLDIPILFLLIFLNVNLIIIINIFHLIHLDNYHRIVLLHGSQIQLEDLIVLLIHLIEVLLIDHS